MCGIIGAVAKRDISPILLEGLKRLEYRGYDSVGLAVIDNNDDLKRLRIKGKVDDLLNKYSLSPIKGAIGIAHTRWATHGIPSVNNAHPHICRDKIALVHNGIIENHALLKNQQKEAGFECVSDTDSEIVVNSIYMEMEKHDDILQATFATVSQLNGAYALGIISKTDPHRLIAVRNGSPLVIGVGDGEYFIASDIFALLSVTQQFIFLEEGDIVDIRCDKLTIYNSEKELVERSINLSESNSETYSKEGYRHYMLKEIFHQPDSISDLLENRICAGRVIVDEFGYNASELFAKVESVKIVACGTSYHAGLIAMNWMEDIAGIACDVEIASEYRYRNSVTPKNSLFVVISQSGETADTLSALNKAKNADFLDTLAICNIAESSITREAGRVFLTHAGPEISVASTKAFTSQLVALFLLVIAIAREHGLLENEENRLVKQLETLQKRISEVLKYKIDIKSIANNFIDKQHSLFLGRGVMLPVSMEGSLKLKEISYIHAEAYAAGELKHGPLALVDKDMPVIVIAPNNNLYKKIESNLQEVKARGGELYVITDECSEIKEHDGVRVLKMNIKYDYMAPILYSIPLQLLAYYVAVIKGADIDQPRNLAKSVTVE